MANSLQSLLLQHLPQPPTPSITQPRKASSSSSTLTATTQDSRSASSIFQSYPHSSVDSTHITYPPSSPERSKPPVLLQRSTSKVHHCLVSGHIFLSKFQSPGYPKRGFSPAVSCDRCSAPDLREAWQCALTVKCGLLLCDTCKHTVETDRMKRILRSEEELRKKKIKLAQQLRDIAREAVASQGAKIDVELLEKLEKVKVREVVDIPVVEIPARTEEDIRRRWEIRQDVKRMAATTTPTNSSRKEDGAKRSSVTTEKEVRVSPIRRKGGRENLRSKPLYKVNPDHPLPDIPPFEQATHIPPASPEPAIKPTAPPEKIPDIRLTPAPSSSASSASPASPASSSDDSEDADQVDEYDSDDSETDDEFNFDWEEEKRNIKERQVHTGKWVRSLSEFGYVAEFEVVAGNGGGEGGRRRAVPV
ncbi:hypothetical protein RUND412_011170 [Rhizina undulata]